MLMNQSLKEAEVLLPLWPGSGSFGDSEWAAVVTEAW